MSSGSLIDVTGGQQSTIKEIASQRVKELEEKNAEICSGTAQVCWDPQELALYFMH